MAGSLDTAVASGNFAPITAQYGARPSAPTAAPATAPTPTSAGDGQSSSAMGDLMSGQVASADAMADQAYQNALANVTTQRSQMLQQYGYNDDGTLDGGNPYGLYQQNEHSYQRATQGFQTQQEHEARDYGQAMDNSRLGEAGNLDAAHSDALARGLHGGGVAGKGMSAAMLSGALQRGQMGTQHSDALAALTQQKGDSDYQHGLGQYQLGMDLTRGLSGLDQEKQQALFTKNSAYNEAMMQEVMARLQNPDQYAGG